MTIGMTIKFTNQNSAKNRSIVKHEPLTVNQ